MSNWSCLVRILGHGIDFKKCKIFDSQTDTTRVTKAFAAFLSFVDIFV